MSCLAPSPISSGSGSSRSSLLFDSFSNIATSNCMDDNNDDFADYSPESLSESDGDGDDGDDQESDKSSLASPPPTSSSSSPSASNTSPGNGVVGGLQTFPRITITPGSPKSKSTHLSSSTSSSSSSSINPIRGSIPQRKIPTRLSPLSPMNALPSPPPGTQNMCLPKSQPLARALFAARMANQCHNDGGPHAGMLGVGNRKKMGKEKVIVPTKAFKTTFELGLTSTELARK